MKKRVLILENDQDTADMLKFLTKQWLLRMSKGCLPT